MASNCLLFDILEAKINWILVWFGDRIIQMEILVLPADKDNYIFMIHEQASGLTAVVDPTDSDVVVDKLREKNWKLDFILNTHHHLDHVRGNRILKSMTGCQIVGSKSDASRIPGIDVLLDEGAFFSIGCLKLQVIDVIGHTSGHIAFYSKEFNILFCGDVLFGLGCGRIFEGTPAQMFKAILKIKALPKNTKIYCSHEYTEKNIDFSLKFEPNNTDLLKRVNEIKKKRQNQEFTVPLLLDEELKTNLFLRTDQKNLQSSVKIDNELALFSYLRSYRDTI